MGLRMIEPWENPRSDMYWFRRRVPVNLVAFMGRSELKFSLKTRDRDEAVLRCNEENLKLERMWHNISTAAPIRADTNPGWRSRANSTARPPPPTATIPAGRSTGNCRLSVTKRKRNPGSPSPAR
jgi:hypothetical protein